MCGTIIALLYKDSETDCLAREEDEHSNGGGQEEHAASKSIDTERSEKRPCQIPNLKDAVDKELGGIVRDSDCVEDLV